MTAVAYYRVVDPNSAVTQVENFHNATLQIAQTTLRSVLGGVDLDSLLSEREHLNESLQHVIDAQTEPWGIKVTTVEIKDVEIPERMQHAIARQAEAERERRAKIINAEGEFQAAAKLAQAADVIGRNPTTLQLRYLQTLREIGGSQNSTVVFPMPIDLVKPMLEAIGSGGSAQGTPTSDGEAEMSRRSSRRRRLLHRRCPQKTARRLRAAATESGPRHSRRSQDPRDRVSCRQYQSRPVSSRTYCASSATASCEVTPGCPLSGLLSWWCPASSWWMLPMRVP